MAAENAFLEGYKDLYVAPSMQRCLPNRTICTAPNVEQDRLTTHETAAKSTNACVAGSKEMKTDYEETSMNSLSLKLLPALAVLAACSQPVAETGLPEDAATATFTYTTESMLRGVKGNHNTAPRGRPASILDVTYKFNCLSEGEQTATQRFNAAKAKVDKTYKVAPLYFDNPREYGQWRKSASKSVMETGCQVTGVTFTKKSSSPADILNWIVKNRIPPAT